MSDEIKRKILFAAATVGFCIAIFTGYKILFIAGISEYAKEFTAACIGAVITIFATAALLKSQNDREIAKDQLSGIFQTKLSLYNEFITYINSAHEDQELTSEEITKLVEWAHKLALVCRPSLVRILYEYIFQLVAFGADSYSELDEEQKVRWKKWSNDFYEMPEEFRDEEFCRVHYASVAKIISTLRDDLSNRKLSGLDENLDVEANLVLMSDLHSIHSIEFDQDKVVFMSFAHQPKAASPKKPRRKPVKVDQ